MQIPGTNVDITEKQNDKGVWYYTIYDWVERHCPENKKQEMIKIGWHPTEGNFVGRWLLKYFGPSVR